MRRIVTVFFLFCVITPVHAQYLISSRAGLITFADGPVFLEQTPFQFDEDRLRELAKGQRLQTATGRAEVQLGPATSLWMGTQASIRMIEPLLTNTSVQLEQGEFFIEIAQKYKKNVLNILLGDTVVELKEIGLYHFSCNPNQMHVYKGKAKLRQNNKEKTVKKGKAADLVRPLKIYKFQKNPPNALLQWAARRSQVLFRPIMLARRMEAVRRQMGDRVFWQQMQQIQEMQARMEQQMQMEQMIQMKQIMQQRPQP